MCLLLLPRFLPCGTNPCTSPSHFPSPELSVVIRFGFSLHHPCGDGRDVQRFFPQYFRGVGVEVGILYFINCGDYLL